MLKPIRATVWCNDPLNPTKRATYRETLTARWGSRSLCPSLSVPPPVNRHLHTDDHANKRAGERGFHVVVPSSPTRRQRKCRLTGTRPAAGAIPRPGSILIFVWPLPMGCIAGTFVMLGHFHVSSHRLAEHRRAESALVIDTAGTGCAEAVCAAASSCVISGRPVRGIEGTTVVCTLSSGPPPRNSYSQGRPWEVALEKSVNAETHQ